MLKNVKIGKILTFSFIILGILVGIVGTIGLVQLNSNNLRADRMFNHNLMPISHLGDLNENALKIQTNTIYMLYERSGKKFEQRNAEVLQWLAEIDQIIGQYESTALTEKERLLLPGFRENLNTYRKELLKCMDYIKIESFVEALGKWEDVLPAQIAVQSGIEELIKLNKEQAAESLKDIQNSFLSSLILMISVGAVSLFISLLLAVTIPRRISRPICEIVSVTEKMSNGNLNVSIDYRSKNEFGKLADGIMKTSRIMQAYIGNISEVLGKMAKGELTMTIDMEYIGDFSHIKTSMVEIIDSLNGILSQINHSSKQVLYGAEQVSSAAQTLSHGSTAQASSVDELSATIQDILQQIKKNSENAQSAKTIAVNSSRATQCANEQMTDMITAMERINDTSKQISKIIKTIDEIAFQTNILALNAAVEAARAGEAGKGFAVVADEVRNLASKSAEAAKDTSALIENSIQAVDRGSRIANETAKSLFAIVEDAKRSSVLISMISEASAMQAQAIMQTTQGVEQISAVVQKNSVTAEESEAASEELTGQADMLNQLVGKFKLKDNTAPA